MSDMDALRGVLGTIGPMAVAVSGGVDSMTLAHVAGRFLGDGVEMMHAVSAAVPPEATVRVRRHARQQGWRLRLIDAGEFDDPDYRANPVNRCFYCKNNLYQTIAGATVATVASGTNLDDLGDYRPGLDAAKRYGVRHPFVEAGIDKDGVRAIARALALDDLAELPASPCLSSRVETGIAIEVETLTRIHATERLVLEALSPSTVRCRVRREGVVVELDAASLAALSGERRAALADSIGVIFAASLPVAFAPYRQGSAFLRGEAP